MRVSATTIARFAGLLLGASLTAATGVGWHISSPPERAIASLDLSAAPTGELGVSPAGAFVSAPRLLAGGPATRGVLDLRNQTGVALAVAVHLRGETGDLDDLARVRVRSAGDVLFDGPLGALRHGMSRVVIAPGAGRRLRVAVTLPATAGAAARGRADRVALLFTGRPAGAS